MSLIIEICPREPRASFCDVPADLAENVLDCTRSGDCEPACEYVRRALRPEFRTVARNAAGEYENRLATDDEITETARAIYFDSETDFADVENAELYLIWSAASDYAQERDAD
jgi:hypothetical protein